MTAGLVWHDPPGQKCVNPASEAHRRISAALQGRAGMWAELPRLASSKQAQQLASAIRRGQIVAFQPRGSFESAVRGDRVWARYVGDSA